MTSLPLVDRMVLTVMVVSLPFDRSSPASAVCRTFYANKDKPFAVPRQ
jgi:hypothetical protein